MIIKCLVSQPLLGTLHLHFSAFFQHVHKDTSSNLVVFDKNVVDMDIWWDVGNEHSQNKVIFSVYFEFI